ncbi:MAG: hypothetical protein U1F66_09460 [bacterium]
MKLKFKKCGFGFFIPALLLASLVACGGNKKGGDSNAQLNAGDVPKVTQAGGGGDTGKDTSTGNENDICDRQGDAYAKFGMATHHSRDMVFQVAQNVGFHALYTAKPANYTAADYAVMHNYFLQADKAVYGRLSAQIETRTAMAQKAAMNMASAAPASPGERTVRGRIERFSDLQAMLSMRSTLFNYYANIFGMADAITWFSDNDLDAELAAATKTFRDQLSNNTAIGAVERAQIERGMVYAAQGLVMRIDNKDFAVHTVFVAEKKDFAVELVPVTEQSVNYAAYKTYTETELAVAKETYTALVEKTEKIEKEYVVATTNRAQLEKDYVEYVAMKDMLEMLFRGGKDYVAAELGTATRTRDVAEAATLKQKLAAIEHDMIEIEAKISSLKANNANGANDAEIRDLTAKYNNLKADRDKIEEQLRALTSSNEAAPAPAAASDTTTDTFQNTLKDSLLRTNQRVIENAK